MDSAPPESGGAPVARDVHNEAGGGVNAVLEPAELLAIGCVFVGWFFMNTLVTQFGDLQLNFHFYNIWAVLQDPMRLATGLTAGDRLTAFAFGLICLAAVMAVFIPLRLRQRNAWLAFIVPLALMVVCATILHFATSSDAVADDGHLGATGTRLIEFANSLVNRASESFARHVSLGLGAYLSFAASLFLAWKGVVRYRSMP